MTHVVQQQQPYPSQAPYQPQQQPHQQPYPQQQQQIVTFAPGAVQNTPYTTLFTASGTPVQIVNVAPNDGTYQGYNTNAARILGWLQIICGVVILIAQIVVTAIHSAGFEGLSGFWASVIFILAGSFGVQSKTKSHCAVVTTMVLSIIAAVFSIGPITQGSIGTALQRDCYYGHSGGYYGYRCGYNSNHRVAIAFHALILIFGLLEGIVAIVAAAYCCHGCCCYTRPGTVLGQNATVGPLPLAAGGMQVTAIQYQQNPAVHYQHNPAVHYQLNPAQYYPAPQPVATSAYPAQAGTPDPLPSYSAAASPPEYREKM